MKKFLKLLLVLIVLAALAAGGVWAYRTWLQKSDIIQYNTESVTRADVASTISATGTVEPEELVNVGAQVNGKIVTFGIDANGKSVDYGSPVKQGMVLANIDDVLYAAEVRSAQAAEQEAQASILSAKASIKQADAKLALAKNNWERAQDLYPKQAMAKSEYDDAEAEFLAATASKLVSEASLAQAEAQLATAEASLDKASRNLGYCVISSPVDGVIIDRRVSIGQTVVSNMSASSIFLIAKDLKRDHRNEWGPGAPDLVVSPDIITSRWYVRAQAPVDQVRLACGDIQLLARAGAPAGEVAFLTAAMTEPQIKDKLQGLDVRSRFRVLD